MRSALNKPSGRLVDAVQYHIKRWLKPKTLSLVSGTAADYRGFSCAGRSAPRHPPRSLSAKSEWLEGMGVAAASRSGLCQRAITLLSRFTFPANWYASSCQS